MSNDDSNLLDYIGNVLIHLVEDYKKIDELRNSILNEYHSLLSRLREIFNMLYNRNIEKSKKSLIEVVSELESINNLIQTVENRVYLEKIIKDVCRETVEAVMLYSFISGDVSILNKIDFIGKNIIVEGFFEFLGEVRRLYLDEVIKGDVKSVGRYIDFLDSSYKLLFSKYFPHYYFPDYKRRVDILRTQVERSKEDFIRIKYGGKDEY